MKKIRNSKKGFTLVEIMCVVAIIVILLSAVGTGIYDTYRRSKNSVIVVGNEHNEQLQDVTTAADQAMAGNQVTAGTEDKSATTGNQVAAEAQGHSGQAMNSLANPTGGSAPLGGVSATIIEAAPDEATTEEARKTAVNAVLGDKLIVDKNDSNATFDLGKMIVSNKPVGLNDYIKNQGISGVTAYITNDNNMNNYGKTVLTNNGIAPSTYNGTPKIVTLTTDGKETSERQYGDKVEVVQYLYYQTKSKDNNGNTNLVLFGTRTIEATYTKKGINFDDKRGDDNGSSWTRAS